MILPTKTNNNNNDDGNETTNQSTTMNSLNLNLWIGLKTKSEMSTINSHYSNFYENQNIDGCAIIDENGKWKIQACNALNGFVCQQITVR